MSGEEFGIGEFGSQFGAGAESDVKTIIDDILRQTGVSVGSTAYREVALSFLNQVYKTVLKGRHWKFMNRELFIDLDPPYKAGRVNMTSGGHEVEEYVGDGEATVINFNVNLLGKMLSPATGGYYRITKILERSKLEIGPAYEGSTSVEGIGYEILHDRYKLDAKVQDVKSIVPMGYPEMKPIGLQQFRNMKSQNQGHTGTPKYYTIFTSDPEAGETTIEVYPAPDKRYSLHIEYNERVTRLQDSGTCFTVIPPEHSDVLVLATRAAIYQDQNNVQLAQLVGGEARSAWARMAGDQSMTDSRARIQADRDYFHRHRNFKGYYGLKHFGKID